MPLTQEIVRIGNQIFSVFPISATQESTNEETLLEADGLVIDTGLFYNIHLTGKCVSGAAMTLNIYQADDPGFLTEELMDSWALNLVDGPLTANWTLFLARFIRFKLVSDVPDNPGVVLISGICRL